MKNNTIISAKNLTVAYNGIDAIKNISFNINKGELVCIIGQNGGGKTTLIKTILGLLKASSGSVDIKSDKISYVPQNSSIDKTFPISVKEVVLSAFLKKGFHPFKLFTKAEKEKAILYLKQVGIENLENKLTSELSGGEFQRLLIARAIASEQDILILDEPTSNVDNISKEKIYNVLKELNNQGKTILIVTHDLDNATTLADKLICINHSLVSCKIRNTNTNSFEEI